MKERGTIAIIGTLNNYGQEISYLKKSIEEKGFKTLLIDISMGGKPSVMGDITCDEIAAHGGTNIEAIRASTNRVEITQIMTKGLLKKVIELHTNGKFDGIIAAGGATTALIACKALQALPFGTSKIIVSSSADYKHIRSQIFGNSDLMIMHTPVDPVGDNHFVINVLERAAGAVCGMTDAYLEKKLEINSDEVYKSCIAMVTFGFSDRCANNVKQQIEQGGLRVVTFHAQGLGDRALDKLIDNNIPFKAVVDLAPCGVSEDMFGGERAGASRRLEAASEHGIPQICVPSGLNFIAVGPVDSMKRRYKKRILKIVDEPRTEAKMTPGEIIKVARVVAHKLSKGNGVATFLFPLKGWSSLEREGDPFYQPEIDRLFIDEFKKRTRGSKKIEVKEIDAHINDELFAGEIVKAVMRVIKPQGG
jgi:uncharacterized protein (UPF0261 family)